MLDLVATLSPSTGVARSCHLFPPADSPLWLAAVDVGLREARRSPPDAPPGFILVGAGGWTRHDALLRAAGESVERFSLIAQNPEPLTSAVALSEGIDLQQAGLLAPGPRPTDEPLAVAIEPWNTCSEPADIGPGPLPGRSWTVPIGLLTDPAPDATGVDTSPSGVAAGPSWAFAASRALLETIERDAAQCCWALRPRLPFHDSLALGDHLEALPGGALADIADYVERHDLHARTVLIPSAVGGTTTAMAFLDGHLDGHPVLATGARAGTSLRDCVASSLREAVQVHSALRELTNQPRPASQSVPVTDEITRAWYCLSAAAQDHYRGWLDRSAGHDVSTRLPDPCEAPEFSPGQLVRALRAEGLRPLLADLTPRLPAAIRGMGWCVVRAVVLGHQQFRMDDTLTWTWLPARSAAWRAALPEAEDVDVRKTAPHPLI